MRKAKENPFCTSRVESLPFQKEGFSLQVSCSRLREVPGVYQIFGPQGSGKTTLLADLRRELLRLDEKVYEVRFSRTISSNGIVRRLLQKRNDRFIFIDSAESLSDLWISIYGMIRQKHTTLVFASTRQLKIPILYHTSTNKLLSLELCDQIIRRSQNTFDLSRLEKEELWKASRGNTRLFFRKLYDHYAGLAS